MAGEGIPLRLKQAAKRIGRTPATLREWLRKGTHNADKFLKYGVGGDVYSTTTLVEEWLADIDRATKAGEIVWRQKPKPDDRTLPLFPEEFPEELAPVGGQPPASTD